MINRLPEKLTLLRKHFGYAQGDIASKLNIPVTEYMKWENGNMIPPIAKLKEISDLYKVTLDSLVDNLQEVVLPSLEDDLSVDIPFLNKDEDATQIIAKPMDDQKTATIKIPSNSLDSQATKTLQANLGETKVMDTLPIQETTVTKIVDEGQAHKEESDRSSSSDNKKRKTRMIIGFSAAGAALVLFGILLIKLFTGNNGIALNDTNRLALGDKFSLYIDKGGSLVRHGTFEPPISFENTVQVDTYNEHVLGLKKEGVVVSSDNNQEVVTWSDITMVASGRTHSVGLKSDGTVVCTGSNAACMVNTWENIKAVYAGNAVTIGIDADGNIKTSGDGLEAIAGQRGVSSVAIGDSQVLLVYEDGHVISYSLAGEAPFDTSSWSDVKEAAVGSTVAVGLRNDGTVLAATADEKLQKKIQNWKDIRYVDACGSTVVAVTRTWSLKGAGDNSFNQYENTDPEDDEEEAEQLEQVKNINFQQTTANVQIKWDKVEHADYYEVTFSPALAIGIPRTASNSASVPANSLEDGMTYTVTVTAHADREEDYKPSEPAQVSYTYNAKTVQLDSVNSIYGTGDLGTWYIEWAAVNHADYYIINIDNMLEDKTDRPAYYMDLTGYEWTDGSQHAVTITAYSNSATYEQSEPTSVSLQFNLPKYNVTVNIAGGQQVIQLAPGNYTLAEILSYISVPEGFTVTDDIYAEYHITSNYGLTVNGSFEGGE